MKQDKFDIGNSDHIYAILHLIGQSSYTVGRPATVAEIARWMNRSKPTARRYCRVMESLGLVYRDVYDSKDHELIARDGTQVFGLEIRQSEEYENGCYKHAYQLYVQRVLKVVLT